MQLYSLYLYIKSSNKEKGVDRMKDVVLDEVMKDDIISREDFEKYFNKKQIVNKQKYQEYLNKKTREQIF